MSEVFSKPPKEGESWDVIIIGSGPAAFTAGIYTTRGALSTLIFAGEKWGGQLMNTTLVDNFPGFPEGILGPELMGNMRKQVERFGARIENKSVTDVNFSQKPFEVFVEKEKYLSRSVIIATGALTKWLGVKGEEKLVGRGISTCAPCDAPFFKDKKVAVVGGGDSAMEEAHILTKYAKEVLLIHRRNEFKATEAMQGKVLNNPKINILWDTEATEVFGDNKLEKIRIKNSKTQKEEEINLDGLFVAIGHKPDSDIFKGKLNMDDKGYILPNFHCATSIKGVFVAGDVLDKDFKQAVVAAGAGCIAAMEAMKYLDES
ncbi:thioredoxin-disulfide reductase [Patescibacteria group bacterium]